VQTWKPRLYIDADVTEDALSYLGDRYNVVTARELGYATRDDDFHAQYAREERRILVTQNERDFWNDQKHPLHMCPGIIVVPSMGEQLGVKVAVALVSLLGTVQHIPPEDWQGRKFKATDDGFQIKQIGFDGRLLSGSAQYGGDLVWDREI
jgi:hypothetical protein